MKNLLCLNALSRTSHLHRGYDLHAGHQYVFNAEAPKQDLVAAIKEKEKSVQDKKEKPEDKAKDIVDEAKTDSLIKAEEDKIQKLAIDPKQKEALQGKFNELKDKRVAEVKKVGDMKEDDLKKVVEDTNKAITEFEKQDGVKGLMDLVEKRDAVLDAVRIRTYKRGDWENMNQRLFKSGIAKDREEIKAIQKLLKIAQDGKVGPETTNALSAFYGIQLGTQIGSETTDEHGNKIDATAKAVTGAEAATAGEAPVAPVTPGGPGAEAVPGAPGAAPADAGKVGPDGKPIDPRVDLPKVKLDGFGQNREVQDPTQDVLNGFSDAKKQQMLNDIAGGKMEITPLQSARIKQVDLLDKAFQSVLTDAKESRTWSEGLQQTWTEASGTTNLRILNLSNDIARAMTELRDKTIKDPDFKPGPGLPANLRSMLVRKFGGDAGTLIGANNGPDSLPAMHIALLNCLRSNRDYGSAERLVQDNILKDEFDAERKKFEPTADEKKEIAKSEKKTREGILSQREVILQGKKNDAYKIVEADLYASIRKENPTISDADLKKQVDGKKDEILAKIDNPENTTRWNSEIDTYTNEVVAYNKESLTNRLIGRHNDGKPFPGLTGAKAEAMEKYSDMMGNGGTFDWADSTQDTILDELIINAPLILCSGFAASAVRSALTAGARGLLLSGRFANVGLKVARVASISESGMALDAAGNVLGKAAEAGKALRMTGSGMGLGVEAAEGTYIVQGTGRLANAAIKVGKIGGLIAEGATFETVNAAMQGQWIGNDEHYVKRIFWSAATLGTFHATGEVASKLTNSISKIANLAPKSVLGKTLQLGVSYPLEVMTMMAVDVARNGYEHGTIDAPTRDELIHALISVGALKMAGGALSFAGKKFMPDKGPGPEGPKIEGGKPEGAPTTAPETVAPAELKAGDMVVVRNNGNSEPGWRVIGKGENGKIIASRNGTVKDFGGEDIKRAPEASAKIEKTKTDGKKPEGATAPATVPEGSAKTELKAGDKISVRGVDGKFQDGWEFVQNGTEPGKVQVRRKINAVKTESKWVDMSRVKQEGKAAEVAQPTTETAREEVKKAVENKLVPEPAGSTMYKAVNDIFKSRETGDSAALRKASEMLDAQAKTLGPEFAEFAKHQQDFAREGIAEADALDAIKNPDTVANSAEGKAKDNFPTFKRLANVLRNGWKGLSQTVRNGIARVINALKSGKSAEIKDAQKNLEKAADQIQDPVVKEAAKELAGAKPEATPAGPEGSAIAKTPMSARLKARLESMRGGAKNIFEKILRFTRAREVNELNDLKRDWAAKDRAEFMKDPKNAAVAKEIDTILEFQDGTKTAEQIVEKMEQTTVEPTAKAESAEAVKIEKLDAALATLPEPAGLAPGRWARMKARLVSLRSTATTFLYEKFINFTNARAEKNAARVEKAAAELKAAEAMARTSSPEAVKAVEDIIQQVPEGAKVEANHAVPPEVADALSKAANPKWMTKENFKKAMKIVGDAITYLPRQARLIIDWVKSLSSTNPAEVEAGQQGLLELAANHEVPEYAKKALKELAGVKPETTDIAVKEALAPLEKSSIKLSERVKNLFTFDMVGIKDRVLRSRVITAVGDMFRYITDKGSAGWKRSVEAVKNLLPNISAVNARLARALSAIIISTKSPEEAYAENEKAPTQEEVRSVEETGSPVESSIKVPEVKSTIGLAYDVLERAMDNGELKGLGDIAFRVTNTLRDFPSTEKVKPEDIMDLHMLADKLPPTATKLAADLRELARQASPGEELIQAAHRELEQLQKNGGLDRVRNNIKSGTDVSIIRSDGSRQVCKAIYLSDVGLTTRVTWTEVVNGKEVSIYKDVQTSDLLKWTDAMGKSEKSPVGPGFKKAEQAAYRELDASKKGESPIKNELRLSIRGTLDGLEALRSKGDTVGLEKAGVELSKAADQLPPTATKLAASLRKLAANLSPKS